MNSETVFIVLYYGGELRVSHDFIPTYIGGRNRPVQIPRRTQFDELQQIIMRSLTLDPAQISVNLVGRFPVGTGFIATHISDDEVCQVVLNEACAQPIVIYVEVNEHPCGDREINSVVECQLGRNSTENITLSSQVEYYGSGAREHEYLAGTSSTAMGDPDRDDINLPYPENQGYETMPSEGSSDDDEEDDSDPDRTDLRETEPSLRVRDLIVGYSSRTSHTEQHLIRSNDYFRSAQTTREWDEDVTFDGPLDNSIFEAENCIPNELVEGICFQDKKQLQFAVQGWCITNNVDYVIYASNKSKFTVLCTHHSDQVRSCLWRLHARSFKRLGGAWKIGSIGSAHTCAHSVLNAGHRQCTSEFISYFIKPVIRNQLDIKSREIVGRIEAKFNIRVSYMKAWDARRKAVKAIFGSWEESYRTSGQFMAAVCSSMPETVYRIHSGQFN